MPDHTRSRLNWQEYALEIAKVASGRSEDPYLKVGSCVLRHDNSIAGVGYNGAPPGIEIDWSDRNDRRLRVVHAEVNALRYTRPGECYILACTLLPCNECLRMIASYGIKELVYQSVYDKDVSSLRLAEEFQINLTNG
ncbi:deoxycytidylate deaminase [Candidatus Pacearchaeota archaeon]|nr:deoxycytidylate deaminase [Candidatus Pacearchaeota archaeon]|tara:strand:- start:1512 stop:1925 length:414 start_codon:yes stop_codon:yes gene_type:complete